MKLPETTIEEPYIEFKFDKKGKLHLGITSSWWGGINDGFISSEGFEGNTCLPKDFNRYIKAYQARKVKIIEKQISILKKKLQTLKKQYL